MLFRSTEAEGGDLHGHGGAGSFSATVYAQQEGETYTTYTDVGGQWFRETASAELLEQYNASAEMNSYLSSTDQWTFQQEEELDGMTTLKFSGTVTGSQVSALMEESGVLDSLGTMQQLGAEHGEPPGDAPGSGGHDH